MSSIAALPNDIFLLIVTYLSPTDLILSRRVSKQFYAAFTESDLSRHLLLQHFPRTRELRDVDKLRPADWSHAFANVARRYHHLRAGIPSSIQKLPLGKSFVLPAWARHFPVAPWHRHLQFEEKMAPFHYPDPLWTFDKGILIFPSAKLQKYVLYDLNLEQFSDIDFDPEGKVVRRIRLHERVLIVEWCENEAYHQLNENEMVYRHFSTAYDVKESANGHWNVIFRSV